jgi:hypothetical protein
MPTIAQLLSPVFSLTEIGALGAAQLLFLGVLLAVVLEVITCFLRFGAGVQATRDTRFLARYTRHVRVHHGYWGVGMLALAPFAGAAAFDTLVIWGIGLALSDALHHFLVLWPITGSHEFHVRYPRPVPARIGG